MIEFTVAAVATYVAFKMYQVTSRHKTLSALRAQYQQSLLQLQAQPSSSERRVEVLRTGRALADYERSINGSGARGLFDETALANDLNAYGGGRKE